VDIAPVNHRYCGWRESAKIVPQIKTATSDLSGLDTRLKAAGENYEAEFPALLVGLTDGINLVQSARILIDFMKEAL